MTALILKFPANDTELRHVLIDGEPWFSAADVCRSLGVYLKASGHVNTYQAVQKLSADEITTKRIGGQRGGSAPTFVNESGLYKLILRCDKPIAREFQTWVTRDVLPAIRKTGGYLLNEDMRWTAAADSREEFPLPRSLSEALRKLADEHDRAEAAGHMTDLA